MGHVLATEVQSADQCLPKRKQLPQNWSGRGGAECLGVSVVASGVNVGCSRCPSATCGWNGGGGLGGSGGGGEGGQGRVGQAKHVAEGAEWAKGSFGTHVPSQGRIAATGCCGSKGPERQAFVPRLFP